MNDLTTPALRHDAESAPNASGGRSISRKVETTALTPAQLDDRAIIRADGARRHVDAFRDIRTRLLSAVSDNFVTLVAPVSSGCGGSFVARNLAVTMTFDHAKHALLVDCNLRHPSQHITMQVDTGAGGLVDYLENPDTDIGNILYDTGLPRLRLIPVGRTPVCESEYFSSFRMRLLLDSLRSRYPDRYIFLDSPPVLGAPDARILADLADVVILVAGYGRDTPADIALAAGNFDSRKFAGVVFNEGA